MSQPTEWQRRDVDGLDFIVEVWKDLVTGEDRAFAKGPAPATVMFYSFETPRDSGGNVAWEMIDLIVGRRVTEYIEKKPNQWSRYWGEDGVFAKMGDRY